MSGLRRDKFSVQHWRRGEVSQDCFVLVPERDPAAVAAIRAYAEATPDAVLAAELVSWANRIEGDADLALPDQLEHRIALWAGILARHVEMGQMPLLTALMRIAGHAAAAARNDEAG